MNFSQGHSIGVKERRKLKTFLEHGNSTTVGVIIK